MMEPRLMPVEIILVMWPIASGDRRPGGTASHLDSNRSHSRTCLWTTCHPGSGREALASRL